MQRTQPDTTLVLDLPGNLAGEFLARARELGRGGFNTALLFEVPSGFVGILSPLR